MAQPLSSRYLHLHQALGLGPMWLRRSAQVLPPASMAAAAAHEPAPTTALPADAHQAALAAVHSATMDAAAKTATPATPTVATPEPTTSPVIRMAADDADTLAGEVAACQACDLHRTRQQALWGQGTLPCTVLLVTPQPSPDDDVAARLLAGKSGELLQQMLQAIGLDLADVFLTGAVKCAPHLDVSASPAQQQACRGFLDAQIHLAQAQAIVVLGGDHPDLVQQITAAHSHTPCWVLPHPARLLRDAQHKRQAWQVLKQLRQHLDSRRKAAADTHTAAQTTD